MSNRAMSFEGTQTGVAPEGWTATLTGSGDPKWTVEGDETAPSKSNVLKQSGRATFPLILKNDTNIKDGFIEVKFKAVAGSQDRAAGIVWRARDANNYYVTRANALEDKSFEDSSPQAAYVMMRPGAATPVTSTSPLACCDGEHSRARGLGAAPRAQAHQMGAALERNESSANGPNANASTITISDSPANSRSQSPGPSIGSLLLNEVGGAWMDIHLLGRLQVPDWSVSISADANSPIRAREESVRAAAGWPAASSWSANSPCARASGRRRGISDTACGLPRSEAERRTCSAGGRSRRA